MNSITGVRWFGIALLFCSSIARGQGLLVGTSAVRITPPVGAPMAGYFHNRGAEGTHDDLYAKVVVMEKDGVRAALLVCDLIGIPMDLTEQVRKTVARDADIPGGNLMISATHTHTGPVLASDAEAYNLKGDMRSIAVSYSRSLPGLIAEAVLGATRDMKAARVSAGVGTEKSLPFNRRFFMKDGTVGWNPGKKNPDILRPAGPIDSQVPVVYFETDGGKPLATYVNFTMHLDTVGGLEFSADYPYTLSKLLAAVRGPEMLTIFSIGAAGNVNHINVGDSTPQSGHQESARIGTILAAEVLETYPHLQTFAVDRIQCRDEAISLSPPPVTPEDVQWAKEVSTKFGKPDAAPFMDQVKAEKIMFVSGLHGKPIETEVQVIALGNQVAWVGLPGEVFVELGLAIKRASPFPLTIVVELASGDIGYVPNREAYPQGAYEPVSARVSQGSGEMMVDTAVRILTDLYRKSVTRE